jgi:hypothetical protein
MYPNETNYVIWGFSPPTKDQSPMGAWGFSIGLKASFAKKCIVKKITKENIDNMTKMGKALVERSFEKDSGIRDPHHFFEQNGEHNMLLKWITVPGNACDLGNAGVNEKQIMEMTDDQMLEYHPHNVDTMRQATMLLSLFIQWYGFAVAVTSD